MTSSHGITRAAVLQLWRREAQMVVEERAFSIAEAQGCRRGVSDIGGLGLRDPGG